MSGEPAHQIDWRRSARDDHLYVREREWEASHTVWLWADRSPSMDFTSHLTEWSKLDRALVVGFALADVLVEGGERVGIPGLMRPSANRNIIEKMAQAIVHDAERAAEPAAEFRAGAVLRGVAVFRLVESDRRIPPDHRPTGGERRARPRRPGGRSGGGNLPLFRPRRIRRIRRASAASPPAAPRPGATTIRSCSPTTAPRCARNASSSAGASPCTAPTADRPSSCSRSTPAWAPAPTPS